MPALAPSRSLFLATRLALGSLGLVCLGLVACTPSGPTHRGVGDRAASPVTERAAEPAAPAVPAAPAAPIVPATAEPSREGWNDAQIAWQPFEAGLARARAENRPVLVVMHADWCSHCRNYAHVFEDPRIVERARELVMVRVDVDDEPAVAQRFELDGRYVPRTYFLAPDGSVRTDVDARRARFRYFFDEHDPASLLAAMDTVLGRS